MSVKLAAEALSRALSSVVHADGPWEEKKLIILETVDKGDLSEFVSWFGVYEDEYQDEDDDFDEDDDEEEEEDDYELEDEEEDEDDDPDLEELHKDEDLSPEELKEAMEDLKKHGKPPST